MLIKLKKIVLMVLASMFLLSTMPMTTSAELIGAQLTIPTRVYLNPATITATEVGQTFTVDICVENVTGLCIAAAGLTFDPSALECINFKDGPFLTSGGGWGEWYLNISGTINNTAGEIYPAYAIVIIWLRTVDGSGVLFTATFRAKKVGTFNVHPSEICLGTDSGDPYEPMEIIPSVVVDVFTVIVEENVYPIVTVSNLTGKWEDTGSYRLRVYDYAFNETARALSFSVTGPPGRSGFCNVTVLKDLLSFTPPENWVVLIDGSEVTPIISENATHTFIYFTYSLSTHKIEISLQTSIQIQFTLSTLYKVNLYVNGTFSYGSSLKVRFYSYSGIYRGQVTVWNRTGSSHVFILENVSHPLNSSLEKATLVLTDDTGTILRTMATFLVRRTHLFSRTTEMVAKWPFASASERITLFMELVGISKQWPYAPT